MYFQTINKHYLRNDKEWYGVPNAGSGKSIIQKWESNDSYSERKEILSKLDQGEEPENLSLYSLASDYKIAMFDYDVLCARDKEYLSFVLKEEDYNTYNENLILSILKKYVDYEYGEIYSVSRAELPLLYAETRDKRNLDTYECIKKIS